MGIRNYLIEGVSGVGKTTACNELQRRGYQAIHGDRELAYQGDPKDGIIIDATESIAHVVDEILHQIKANEIRDSRKRQPT
ncbi:hypothetical protein [Paenibacillus qinlingensis]|uniref:Broad-specificity NMP kinase n=1 Tax=Paenibacillus qinlingensis TaxID=1837343 RepID=A0ABU1NWE1_9BACL|nr:hypothetical protein [Paenibacillus qinlingensis]MDR6551806.1 broad-specificity NMP kinase [Paenibacillus qinlingensis]